MKKIAFITDGWERYVTYAWIEGYRRYTAEHPLTADLYVFHSFGNFSKDQNFNTGEYNIIQLPDLSAFDGIILDLANILNVSIKKNYRTCRKSFCTCCFSYGKDSRNVFFRHRQSECCPYTG